MSKSTRSSRSVSLLLWITAILCYAIVLVSCASSDRLTANPTEAAEEWIANIEINNPLPTAVNNHVVPIPLSISDQGLKAADLDRLAVVRVTNGEHTNVPNDYTESSVKADGAGNVKSLELLIQDDFPAGSKQNYRILLGRSPISRDRLLIEDLNNDGMGDFLHVDNERFDFFLGHELEPLDIDYNGQLPKDLYVRVDQGGNETKIIPLVHIYMNTPEFRDQMIVRGKCEPLFVISPGLPTSIDVESNSLMARVSLRYEGQRQGLCPPSNILIDPKPTNLMRAEVDLVFYRNSDRVESTTRVTITDTFYNHIGFSLGGVETGLERPRVLFGTESHRVLQGTVWADTQEKTDIPEFMQIQNGKFVFRRAGNRDAWAPFTSLGEDDEFKDYYVVEDAGGAAVLAYFPDFQGMAFRGTRDEGTGEILALNMIGAGPSIPIMPPNPIMLTQTHLGGLGGFWVPIPPGQYVSRLTALIDQRFDPEGGEYYDETVSALAKPLVVRVTAANRMMALSTPTSTFTPSPTATATPTATPVPTPAAANCDPPQRDVWSWRELPEGSLLPFFDRYFYRYVDGIGMIDNRTSVDFANTAMPPALIPGPFTLTIEADEDAGAFMLSGRLPRPSDEWWEGTIQMAIEPWAALTLRDGTSSTRHEAIVLEGEEMPIRWVIHFYERCGKRFSVHNGEGDLLGYFDVGEMPMIDLPNGLFPDGVVHFGMYTEPGGSITLHELSVAIP